jgi:hypothetical protein
MSVENNLGLNLIFTNVPTTLFVEVLCSITRQFTASMSSKIPTTAPKAAPATKKVPLKTTQPPVKAAVPAKRFDESNEIRLTTSRAPVPATPATETNKASQKVAVSTLFC